MPRNMQRVALAGAVLLAGCATVDIDQSLRETNEAARDFTQGKAELSRTTEQRQARDQLSQQLLAKPLSMDEAVQLALANSPSFQSLLAQGWAELSAARQTGRIGNPVFTFERMRLGSELELGRLLSIGLLDLLTLPRRHDISRNLQAQAKLQLTANVVDQVSRVRQAWVRAVAAQQTLGYAEQVQRAAQASAELARRMQEVGNF